MGEPRNAGSGTVDFEHASRPRGDGDKQHSDADGEQDQVKDVAAGDRPVTAKGGVKDEEIDQQDRDAVGDVEEGGSDHPEPLDLDDQIKDVHRDKDCGIGHLEPLGAKPLIKKLGDGQNFVVVETVADPDEEKCADKPGEYRIEHDVVAALVDASGQAMF